MYNTSTIPFRIEKKIEIFDILQLYITCLFRQKGAALLLYRTLVTPIIVVIFDPDGKWEHLCRTTVVMQISKEKKKMGIHFHR